MRPCMYQAIEAIDAKSEQGMQNGKRRSLSRVMVIDVCVPNKTDGGAPEVKVTMQGNRKGKSSSDTCFIAKRWHQLRGCLSALRLSCERAHALRL